MQSPINDISASNSAPIPVLRPKRTAGDICAEGAVGFGLGLSAIWTFFLGYGFTKLVASAIFLVY